MLKSSQQIYISVQTMELKAILIVCFPLHLEQYLNFLTDLPAKVQWSQCATTILVILSAYWQTKWLLPEVIWPAGIPCLECSSAHSLRGWSFVTFQLSFLSSNFSVWLSVTNVSKRSSSHSNYFISEHHSALFIILIMAFNTTLSDLQMY